MKCTLHFYDLYNHKYKQSSINVLSEVRFKDFIEDNTTYPWKYHYATEDFVNTAIANLVNSAPETLDTLGELATALQKNQDVVNAVNQSIATKANKTDVEALSTTVQTIDEQIASTIPNFKTVVLGNDTLGSIYDALYEKFGNISERPILLKTYGVTDFSGFIEFINSGFPTAYVYIHNISYSSSKTARIEKMVSLVDHFEYIVTDSEAEALILECNLIKKHRPQYNVMLKDDKSYPYILLTHEDFPRLVK